MRVYLILLEISMFCRGFQGAIMDSTSLEADPTHTRLVVLQRGSSGPSN